MKSKALSRTPRYVKPLSHSGGPSIVIPNNWGELAQVPLSVCEPRFLAILENHGFAAVKPVIPLRNRYTRGRPWTREEFTACFNAWQSGLSLTLIAAALNRNPQDMIYRLLDYCHKRGIAFTEEGRSEGSEKWTPKVAECAAELFSAGLPAWKIAALFQVDFEYVEKQLFLKRDDYGHRKRNPFAINTRHKHLLNKQVISSSGLEIRQALDAFAGEGNTTTIISTLFPDAHILAIESDPRAFENAQKLTWGPNVDWIQEDNLDVMRRCIDSGQQFDLIDLDPFVTCHEQLRLVWPLLKASALLFVTFGGEYRRSFIASNRKAIVARYGFSDMRLPNKEYLEVVPFFFLGWVAQLASSNLFVFSVLRAVRYANNCRFWLRVERANRNTVKGWMAEHITSEDAGYRFQGLDLPRFAQVRHELDNQNQMRLF
ncbi:MAG: class I SAM-dependent methyltransferase [Planctomycetota bacterium]|jgi:hypothetical protein